MYTENHTGNHPNWIGHDRSLTACNGIQEKKWKSLKSNIRVDKFAINSTRGSDNRLVHVSLEIHWTRDKSTGGWLGIDRCKFFCCKLSLYPIYLHSIAGDMIITKSHYHYSSVSAYQKNEENDYHKNSFFSFIFCFHEKWQ